MDCGIDGRFCQRGALEQENERLRAALNDLITVVRRVAAADGAGVSEHYAEDDTEHVFVVPAGAVRQARALLARIGGAGA